MGSYDYSSTSPTTKEISEQGSSSIRTEGSLIFLMPVWPPEEVGRNLHSSHCRSIRISQYKKSVVRIVIEADKAYNCEAYRPLFSYMSYHISLPKYKSKKPVRPCKEKKYFCQKSQAEKKRYKICSEGKTCNS